MKKIILFLVLASLMSGCTDGVVDVITGDFMDAKNIYNTENREGAEKEQGVIKTITKEGNFLVVYDKETLVMYASSGGMNGVGALVPLVDSTGAIKLFNVEEEKYRKEKNNDYFLLAEEQQEYKVVCDNNTKVMYLINMGLGSVGDLSLMLNADGKPKLCE